MMYCIDFHLNIFSLYLEITLKLTHLIFGYKISDKNYYGVNYFITILSFSIYKSYYLSEQKTKKCKCLENASIIHAMIFYLINSFI
jgi:hypothetical protein